MNSEEVLILIDNLITPERLNEVQELVLSQCWLGRTYQEIALISDYDADYIRVVGFRLWQTISDACGEKISKNNIHSTFRQIARQQHKSSFYGELLKRHLPLNSSFYIERPPVEAICYAEVAKSGALIRIKASPYMGKTSLMTRILAHTNSLQYSTVSLSLQQADHQILHDLDKFLRWICANISHQLNLESLLDEFWDKDLGSKVSCTNYLQKYILPKLKTPLVLALDEVNRIFEYKDIAQEFLPLIRFWHEAGNSLSIWQKLRLIVVHSTEIYTPLNLNQSPFNIGLAIKLPEFNLEQMRKLAQRYQLDWSEEELEKNLILLRNIIGGHPYFLRLAFDYLTRKKVTIKQLLENASTQTGIYSDLLCSYLVLLQKYPELGSAFKQVINAKKPITLETITAYQLESMGLVKLIGDRVTSPCELYRLYFGDRLDQF